MSTQSTTDFTDTSRYSYYVQSEFYDELERLNQVFDQEWPDADADALARVQSFLARESRLIDTARLNEWLDLYTDECLYWLPITAGGGNPRSEVSHAFDDRRRLTDRVYWLRTGLAYSQLPASRTRRLITNIETTTDTVTGARLVRSNFAIHEFRAEVTKIYSGWYAHVLQETSEGLKIQVKQINLLDSEQLHENLTLVF